MKEQPRSQGHRNEREIDLSFGSYDDEFFDLPDYQPHTEQPAKSKPPRAPKVRSGNTFAPAAWIGKHLATLVITLVITTLVVLVAYGATITDQEVTPPPSDEQQTPPVEDPPSTVDPQPETPEPTPPEEIYTYAADVSAYQNAIEHTQPKKSILLLNKANGKGVAYAPESMALLDRADTLYGKEVYLDVTTAAALQAMLLCMRAEGITDTFVTSGYRSYTYQSQLFALYINQEMAKNPALTRDQATAIVETYSSRPGYSEHQSGLCVDLMTTTMGSLDISFERTEAFAWLQENAAQFGFILRYPKDKEDITGYTYEPWHYRFVGKAAALEISRAGITLEEYLDKN